jgi:hypothetical protein
MVGQSKLLSRWHQQGNQQRNGDKRDQSPKPALHGNLFPQRQI